MKLFVVYFMTTSLVVCGGKVNTLLPINRFKRTGKKVSRNIITYAKNHTHMYELLGEYFHPYITNKRLHRLHHPHDYQTKKGLNTIFACYPPKIRTTCTTMNMMNFIIIDIAFRSSRYEYIFKISTST